MTDPVNTDALRAIAAGFDAKGWVNNAQHCLAAADEVDRLRRDVRFHQEPAVRATASPGLVLDTLIALPHISSAGLRKIADEAQRIIDGRMEDGVFE